MRFGAQAWLLFGIALLAGCPAPATPNHPGGSASARTAGGAEASCSHPLPSEQPALAPAPAATLPDSMVALTVRLPLDRLKQAIEQRVPVELAAGGGQNVGIGRLSYSVRRQPIELHVEQGKLIVDIPVTGYAEVCVPMGSACPRLSSCSPALTLTAAIPLGLTADYTFGHSEVSTRITRGCVIAGIDATSRFSGAAASQAAAAGRRIDQSLPSLRPEVEAAWNGLAQPMPLGSDACLVGTPKRVIQAPATTADGVLGFHVGIAAELRREAACPPAASPATVAPLPPPESVATLDPTSDLVIGAERPWSEVARELERSVGLGADHGPGTGSPASGAASAPPTTVGPVPAPPAGLTRLTISEARAVGSGPTPLLASRLVLDGTVCGEVWLGAVPRLAAASTAAGLGAPALLAGQPGRAGALGGLGLESWFGSRAQLDLGPAVGTAALEAIRQRLEQAARQRASDTSLTAEGATSARDPLQTAASGLVSVERAHARLTATLR